MTDGALVLALLDLPADLPLVIGAQQAGPVVAEGRLGGRANDASARRTVAERRS